MRHILLTQTPVAAFEVLSPDGAAKALRTGEIDAVLGAYPSLLEMVERNKANYPDENL